MFIYLTVCKEIMSKQFYFKPFSFTLVHYLFLFNLSGATTPVLSGPGSDVNKMGTLPSLKFQHY